MEQEIKPTPSKDEEKLSNNHNINQEKHFSQLKHQTVPSLPGSLYFPNFFSDQLADSLFEYVFF